MYCVACGTPLPDGARFCPSCGRAVAPSQADGYRSPRLLARWTVALVALTGAVSVVAAFSDYAEQNLYQRMIDERFVSLSEAQASDDRQAVIAVLQVAVLLAAAVLFILWLRRCYANLDSLGGRRRYSLRWTVWGWFVPIMWFWRPKQVVNDLLISDARPRAAALVNWWWASFLVSNGVSWVSSRMLLSGDTAKQLHDAALAGVVADVLDVGAAVLAVLMVRRLTADQESGQVARPATAPP